MRSTVNCFTLLILFKLSYKVNEAIYYCDWMKASPSFKKSVQIILMRTNRPSQIYAGKFYPVSLDIFRSVMKTAYSFYTLLAQMDTPAHHHDHTV